MIVFKIWRALSKRSENENLWSNTHCILKITIEKITVTDIPYVIITLI